MDITGMCIIPVIPTATHEALFAPWGLPAPNSLPTLNDAAIPTPSGNYNDNKQLYTMSVSTCIATVCTYHEYN